MKTLYTTALLLFITFSFSAKKITIQEKINTLVATYKGPTEDQSYKFIDDKNVEHIFYDMLESIEFEEDDDTNIDKIFTLTWTTKLVDEYDSEGEETGLKITVKTILSVKEKK